MALSPPSTGSAVPLKNLRIVYFGSYRAEYSRNKIMIEGLRQAGVEVIECNEVLWHGIEDRVEVASGGWTQPRFWLRLVQVYVKLIQRFFRLPTFDILVVGYPGQLDIFLARWLSWLRRKPLVWDVFMSIYLVAWERGLHHRSAFSIGLLKLLEKIALRQPDLLIQDTAPYVAWFGATHGISASRFRLVPTGADDRVFHPLPYPVFPPTAGSDLGSRVFKVLYYGTFIPNHGVEYIVEAARLLKDDPEIYFELVGDGPDRPLAQTLAEQYNLTNVKFLDALPQADLVQRTTSVHVCLGAFGTTPQSLMTVQNKIYESLAMARPVLTGDSPAITAVFSHGIHLYLASRADPQSIADGLRRLKADPQLCQRLAETGRSVFAQNYTIECLGALFRRHLEELIAKKN